MSKPLTIEQKKSVFCIKHGHSRIVTAFFGYVHCARCGQQVADTLLGLGMPKDAVVVDHNCKICDRNAKKLTATDKVYISNSVLHKIGTTR